MKKPIIKAFSLLMVIAMTFSLVACEKDSEPTPTTAAPESTTQPAGTTIPEATTVPETTTDPEVTETPVTDTPVVTDPPVTEPPVTEAPVVTEPVKLDYDKLISEFVSNALNTYELTIGEFHVPIAAIWLEGGMGEVYSSNESVATITAGGTVEAVGEGSAYIVISVANGTMYQVYRYDVYTEAPEANLSNLPKIEGIDFAAEIKAFQESPINTKTLKIGEGHTPTASVWAQNGGTCYTSDASVVTVGKNGTVMAVGRGTAYVIIKASFGNMFEIYKYVVNGAPAGEPPVTEPPVTEPPVTEPPTTAPPITETPVVTEPVGMDYDKLISEFVSSALNTYELTIGEFHVPNAAIWLENGMGEVYSSNESVATITTSGTVEAVGEGSAYIVISVANGTMYQVYRYDVYAETPEADLSNLPKIDGIDFAAEIKAFQESPLNTKTLKIGEGHTPTASVWAQNGGTCYTSDASVVTVGKNGTVMAVGRGTAYVIIKSSIGNMFQIYKYMVNGDSATP